MSSKTVIALMTITILAIVAAAVSSTIIVKAQNGGAIQHACPAGTISFSQGQCTVQTTTTVSEVCPMTIPNIVSVTGPGEGNRCNYRLSSNSDADTFANRNNCAALGGLFNDQVQPQTCILVPAVCPEGSTGTGTSCIVTTTTAVKPGRR